MYYQAVILNPNIFDQGSSWVCFAIRELLVSIYTAVCAAGNFGGGGGERLNSVPNFVPSELMKKLCFWCEEVLEAV